MRWLFASSAALVLSAAACGGSCSGPEPDKPSPAASDSAAGGVDAKLSGYVLGMVLAGAHNDKGWNQAHVEGIQEALAKMPDAKFDYVDKINSLDRPHIKAFEIASHMISRGARFIAFTADDHKDDALEIARQFPAVVVLHISGDYAWKEGKNFKDQKNLGNLRGRVEDAKLIAGCAAALSTESGKLGYVGTLGNDETRRLVSSAYLGARHCWVKYRKMKAEALTFKVTWIGASANIPGVTLDPSKVVDEFYDSGIDVALSGLDTEDAALSAKKAAEQGKKVRFVPYYWKSGCDLAPDLCLGVPYVNWTPAYRDAIEKARAGKYMGGFSWPGIDWSRLNDDNAVVGFLPGNALGKRKTELDAFIKELASGLNLFTGPLHFQDGSEFLTAGKTATPQELWYLPELLQGISGLSR